MTSIPFEERLKALTQRHGLGDGIQEELVYLFRTTLSAASEEDDDDAFLKGTGLDDDPVVLLPPMSQDAAMLSWLGGSFPDGGGLVSEVEETIDMSFPVETEQRKIGRYEDLGLIGEGAMGEVRRVRDLKLNRVLALKAIHPEVLDDAEPVARFIEESQATAQLQHPGIVPVYELGKLPDGRLYFTMQEVKGRTLLEVIREVHHPAEASAVHPTWNFRRLIGAFYEVCETVAYAHNSGVMHRDIKPQNIMVGDFGEVLVLDWGLAKILGRRDRVAESQVSTERHESGVHATQIGQIMGTPLYMPPEQAMGEIDALGPASDVYSLGAVLYELLSGRPPFQDRNPYRVLHRVKAGDVDPLEGDFPEELGKICLRAMAFKKEERYANAKELAQQIAAWLEGQINMEKAQRVVSEADALLPEVARLREQAERFKREAEEALESVKPCDSIDRKRLGWEKEDEAERLSLRADIVELDYTQSLRNALIYMGEMPEAHSRLASYYRRLHGEALVKRDPRNAARAELLLRAHDQGQYEEYLRGDGSFSLATDPPGADVTLYRYEVRDRRSVPVLQRELGKTPLRDVVLPSGSYLVVIRSAGCREVRYPILIERQRHWDGCPATETSPFPIRLPRDAELRDDEVYVPAGWFVTGGDAKARNAPAATRAWVGGFIMQRLPVINEDYLEFFHDLADRGRHREALRLAPGQGNNSGKRTTPVYDLRAQYPVHMVDWFCATSYAQWLAKRTGFAWRMPRELEWEKSARGVDGRYYPWGDYLDSTWCNMHESHSGPPHLVSVNQFSGDESPYGIRGLGGNVRDWCEDDFEPVSTGDAPDDKREKVVRGGEWNDMANGCRSANRIAARPSYRGSIGIRLVRSFPAAD